MRYLIIIFFTLSLTFCYGQPNKAQDNYLFKIIENGKTGFINSTGQSIINPKFWVAGDFSEGLAEARINGTYGYIDNTGNFIIQPQFDYATPFSEGLALVYKEAQPFFINKNGQKAFEFHFQSVDLFKNGKARVKTFTDKYGIINKKGELIIDTVFSKINPFSDGLSIVQGINHHYANHLKGTKNNYEVGIIDTLGQFIAPYGKYKEIKEYENGFFIAEIPAKFWDTIIGNTTETVIIDRTGKIIISKDHKNHCYISGNIHCGLAKMNLYRYWIPEKKGVYSTSEKDYQGFMNLKGEIFINDTVYKRVEDFSDNRAFVADEDQIYSIINTQGKVIANKSFYNKIRKGFVNGFAFVADNSRKWGIIDTNANFIFKPQFDGINDIGMIDDYFFFTQINPDKKSEYYELTGIAKKDGSIIFKPIIQEFDKQGFQNGLLKCKINNKLAYINTKGEIVWQETYNINKKLNYLNIDFMNRGYFYANSKSQEGEIINYKNLRKNPEKISKSDNIPSNSIMIVVRPEIKDTIFGEYNGITVLVSNTSKNKIDFYTQEGCLSMIVQALNLKNEWKDIESWSPNQHLNIRTVTLDSNYYWTFKTPVYKGDIKTKLRIKLKYINPNATSEKYSHKKEITIYSNEYDGSINPGQLWRMLNHQQSGEIENNVFNMNYW
jgi:hypothetical protein